MGRYVVSVSTISLENHFPQREIVVRVRARLAPIHVCKTDVGCPV